MTISNEFPLQQGKLDHLCSVYALLNMLYLQGKLGSVKDAGELFNKIIIDVKKCGNLSSYITKGINQNEIPWLLRFLLDSKDRKKYKDLIEEIYVINIFKNEKDIYKFIKGSVPIFVYFSCDDGFNHYTIIKKIGRNGRIYLFDSYEMSEIYFDGVKFTLDKVPISKFLAWVVHSNPNRVYC